MARSAWSFSAALLCLCAAGPSFAQGVCTYKDATTSFGASYTTNAESAAVAAACTTSSPTAARLNNTSYARSVITAPGTGDYKFLVKNTSATDTPATFEMIQSQAPNTLTFPDPTLVAPVGGGCGLPGGIPTIEDRLHRKWPLFGQTFYYGDYLASPPNDPTTVVTSSSPYVKWVPFAPGEQFIYLDSAGKWGPAGGLSADGMHPPQVRGYADGCAQKYPLGALRTACQTCLSSKGYYLNDVSPGDLKGSVFTGTILNDYSPAWTSLAWAFGFVTDFKVNDTTGKSVFPIVRDLWQSSNSSCGAVGSPQHVGGNFQPTNGGSSCSLAYPTWNQAAIDALTIGGSDTSGILNDESNIQQSWAGGVTIETPANDMLFLAQQMQQFTTAGRAGACPYCQAKAVLYIGFGVPCGEPNPPIPPQTVATCTGECRYTNPAPECSCQVNNKLPEMAHYLYNNLNTRSYFIGLGAHTTAMRRSAVEGHGAYFDGTSVESFHDALLASLTAILQTGTSSATSTVNAVQVNVAGQEELVPRFVASANGIWEGHLNKYFLFSEFAGNCGKSGDTAPIPNSVEPVCTATCVCPGGSCTGRWLVDSTCKLIAPDPTGFLFQSTWNGSALVPSTTAAVPVWDVNDSLRSGNWYQRKIYTAIDTNADFKIDASDGDGLSPAGMYSITRGATAGASDLSGGVTDAVADALLPYMALDGTTMCADIETALGITLPAINRLRACARIILNFALGEDLLNENQLAAGATGYRVNNRVHMLGDIFHSSPQDIGPPASEDDCATATRRCVATLFNGKKAGAAQLPNFHALEAPALVADPATGTLVVNPGGVYSYQAYYQNETFRLARPHVSTFGSNDGIVHGIQTACYVMSSLSAGKYYPVYWEGAGNTPCVAGSAVNGSELWGFIPPDLLPKLGFLITGKHQFFVDNSPMVRDIYAPTSANATKRYTVSSASTMDFKRIAVYGEREGGTHWFAMDVTDPTAPTFRWIFPQPNSPDELTTGYSYGDWVPNAPPIVPVRLAAPGTGAGYPSYSDSLGSAPYQEKWIALLPGGYDPYGIAGKTVYALDAYTGAKLFQTVDSASVKQAFPFAALPAAVAWGTGANSSSSPNYNDGYFDSAVIGDTGGQVWTLRFNDIGLVSGTTGLVTNWLFGRSFRESLADDTGAASGEYRMQHRTPIFQMASVARMAEGTMRAFIGTGDRANMAENGLGDCSVYNPLACGKRRCTTTLATNASISGNPAFSGVSSYSGDLAATFTSTTSASFTSGGSACSPDSTTLSACVSCAGAGSSRTTAAAGQPQYACTNTTSGWQCAIKPISPINPGQRLETASATLSPAADSDINYFSRFIAFNVFDSTRSPFTTSGAATSYDSKALTETDLLNLFAANTPKTFSSTVAPSLTAKTTGASNGYYFSYPVLDERTATNSVLLQNCVSWYTMEPGVPCNVNSDCSAGTCNTTTHTCVAPNACGASTSSVPARTAFLYQINASDGSTNCGLTSSTSLRTAAPTNSFIVPPPPAQALVSVNSKGQTQFSIIAPAGQLSLPASQSSGGSTPFSFFYTIETPRELHECRHNMNANACY